MTDREWLSCADLGAMLGVTPRVAFNVARRLGVPMLGAPALTIKGARFRRADWEAAADRAARPAGRDASANLAEAAPRVRAARVVPGLRVGALSLRRQA